MKIFALLTLCLTMAITASSQDSIYTSYDRALRHPDPTSLPESQQSRQVFKLNLFSIFTGSTEISYEHWLKKRRSIEASVGIIGLGRQLRFDNKVTALSGMRHAASGAYLGAGYKFIYSLDARRFRYNIHLLDGPYFKPTIYYGQYKERFARQMGSLEPEIAKQRVSFLALQLEVGQQWVFGNVVSLDLYFGLGVSSDNKGDLLQDDPTTNYYNEAPLYKHSWNYALMQLGDDGGLGVNFGLRVGWLH